MPYTTNPAMPRVRAKAIDIVKERKSIREVARHFGFNPSTVMRWVKKAPVGGCFELPTKSSRPNSHPRQLKKKVVQRIRTLRGDLKGRCAEVITKHLHEEGIKVHRITVQRTLDRLGLTKKRSPWKRFHLSGDRPIPTKPGSLVQMDTIHIMKNKTERIYIYTLIDVYSRWCYALAVDRINTRASIEFFRAAQKKAGFVFECIQTDHGPEFSQHFTEQIGVLHRHSRVRKPNDNAHVERFNRTIQQELLSNIPNDVTIINKVMLGYLRYYNTKRYHLGINLKTPADLIRECCQAIV